MTSQIKRLSVCNVLDNVYKNYLIHLNDLTVKMNSVNVWDAMHQQNAFTIPWYQYIDLQERLRGAVC